jgi:hypothetical protein
MTPYVGQYWLKVREAIKGCGHGVRLAQCSAVDKDYAYMYWPDKDQQTRVKLHRFGLTTEWRPA